MENQPLVARCPDVSACAAIAMVMIEKNDLLSTVLSITDF